MLPPQFDVKVFGVACSAAARAVWLYLQECEALFVFEKLVPEEIAHKIDDISPKRPIGVVLPVLHDAGVYVYGCVSILKYLAEKFQKYYPSDRVDRAKVDMYFEWHTQYLHKATALVLELTTPSAPGLFRNYIAEAEDPNHASGQHLEKRTTDIELVGAAIKDYISTLNVLEKVFLSQSDFVCGNALTIADLYAATELSFLQIIEIDMKEYPKLTAWMERVKGSLKSWAMVNAEFEEYLPNASKQQMALRQEQKDIKRHGKDARGGAKPPDICHRVLYHRPIHEVYQMFLDEAKMAEMTGKACAINAKPGGKVSFYDGLYSGSFLYLMENLKLLQSWTQSDWPAGATSTVKMAFSKASETKTEVIMEQSDIPKGFLKKVDEGWHTMFWMPTNGVLLRDIAYTLFFEAGTPHMVYELLLDAGRISKYTSKKCDLSRGVGAQFSLLDGLILGTNLELVTDARISQEWRCNDWTEPHTSKVVIQLKRVPLGTEMSFSQLNVPVEKYKGVVDIWEKYFWKNIRKEIKTNYDALSSN